MPPFVPFDPLRVLRGKLFSRPRPPAEFGPVVAGETWACVDLGAFARPLPRLPGLTGVVIMEDRDPFFFLTFDHYRPWAPATLNRHGPRRDLLTQHDLKLLVNDLKLQGISVLIGVWNYAGFVPRSLHPNPFLRAHPELTRTPGSSDLYPFVTLRKEGITYAEYIAHQYEKLVDTFGFDGLMLGDGFCGFRSFGDPDRYRDMEHTIPQWTEFYATVARAVHHSSGLLFAYDCQGLSASEARRHGVDYRELARVGLTCLVFQSYPQAWGEYWLARYADRFDLEACRINLTSVKKALAGTATKVLYTVELGDVVEGWSADPAKTRRAMEVLDPLADGRFLVWANDLIARLPSVQ